MSQTDIPNPDPANSLPLRKRLERTAGRIGLRLVVGPVRALPFAVARSLGTGLGDILYCLLGRYRRVAIKNLALVYGNEKSAGERKRMARAVFRHFGAMAFEFLKTPQLSRTDVDRLARVQGEEHLRAAFRAGKGVLFITGHFGNWEFLARWLVTHGYPLNVVARRANDPEADKLLFDTREGSGAQVFARGNSVRGIFQSLKNNQIVALLPDQNAADVFVPFFGYLTGTVNGPGVLHLRTGAPLVFGWCVRSPDNHFAITFEPPVEMASTGDQNADVIRIMALINARLEAQVRCYPTQWLWLHDRWKATPEVFRAGATATDEADRGGRQTEKEQ